MSGDCMWISVLLSHRSFPQCLFYVLPQQFLFKNRYAVLFHFKSKGISVFLTQEPFYTRETKQSILGLFRRINQGKIRTKLITQKK